jgi:hypothetical protein
MSKVRAEGTLVHQFHGKYACIIGVTFKTPEEARDALRMLGEGWKTGEKHPNVLIWQGDSAELDELKERLKSKHNLTMIPCGYSFCPLQCRESEIDNVNHSVDRGGNFSIEFDIVPVEQTPLFGE